MKKFRELVKGPVACIPVAVMRFVLFVPFGVYVGLAEKHWNVISSHPELYAGIYDPSIPPGEQFARKWGQFCYYWNFAVWFPGMLIPAPFTLPFTLVDISAAILVSLSTSHQTAYSPHKIDICKGTGPHDWRLPPGATESFFEASARLNATATTPGQMCKSYVQEWQYGISVSVLYGLLALSQLVVCCLALIYHYVDSKRQNESFWKPMIEALVIIPKMTGLVILAFVYYIPVIFFRCLPISVKGRTRYARRYAVKAGTAVVDKSETQLGKLSKKTMGRSQANKRYRGTGDGEQTGLADFLGIYDILMLVIEDLHYTDIVNLSLASKSVREAVLPAEDYDRRIQHFKMYTCDGDHKAQCWVCSNQTCPSCSYTRGFRRITPYFHLENCVPYCKACYKKFSLSTKANPPICGCAPKDLFPAFWRRVDPDVSVLNLLPIVNREVCRQCVDIPEADIWRIREERTAKELKGHGNVHDECDSCKGVRGRGPRWWVCTRCRLECTAGCHEAWRKKKGSSEVPAGDDAV